MQTRRAAIPCTRGLGRPSRFVPVPPLSAPCPFSLLERSPRVHKTLVGLKMAFPDVVSLDPLDPGWGSPRQAPGRLLWGLSPAFFILEFVLSGPSPRIQWLRVGHLLFLSSVQFVLWRDGWRAFPREERGGRKEEGGGRRKEGGRAFH